MIEAEIDRRGREGIDETIKLMEAVAKLVGVLAGPAVALFVLVRFGASLQDFIAGFW